MATPKKKALFSGSVLIGYRSRTSPTGYVRIYDGKGKLIRGGDGKPAQFAYDVDACEALVSLDKQRLKKLYGWKEEDIEKELWQKY